MSDGSKMWMEKLLCNIPTAVVGVQIAKRWGIEHTN
jgi:hypothetical protein